MGALQPWQAVAVALARLAQKARTSTLLRAGYLVVDLLASPLVLLVVQGGPGTLQTVHQAPDLALISR